MKTKILAMILMAALIIPSTPETVSMESNITKYETIENYGFSPIYYEYEELDIVENEVESVMESVQESTPEYSLTEEEINLIALVTMAEAEGESELGKRLVIDTILNRVDHEWSYWPDSVEGVIYQKGQFSSMWNGRVDRCYVMDEIVQLVKEELLNRTNYDVVYFMMGGYSSYGTPEFKEGVHYFSSY